ncbi:hypothetical protein LP420_31460 [Massilia sp. B-10]|nr:hypothetical protein LP420_31460 [Massilia sp. B-10]
MPLPPAAASSPPARRADTLIPAPHPVAVQVHVLRPRETNTPPCSTIHVSIGRVEIHAVSAPPVAARAAPSATLSLSLEQFLAQQKRGHRDE